MARIVVNGRFLEKRLFGIGRYAIEVTQALKELVPSIEVMAPTSIAAENEAVATAVGARGIGRLHGHAWEQFDLPRSLWKVESPVLVNLMNTAPVLYGPQITVIHDIAHRKYPEGFRTTYRLFHSVLTSWTIRASARLVAVSEFTRQEMAAECGLSVGRISVVHAPISRRIVELSKTVRAAERGRYVLTVSTLSPRKNLPMLLEAFARIDDESLSLVVVGSRRPIFRDDLPNGSSHDRVMFLGSVDDEELVALYKGAEVFVYPSLYEGFGLPPLEAMACGCPTVVSNSASMPEVCGEAAWYVDARSAEKLASTIEVVLLGGDEVNRRVALGRERVRKYDGRKAAMRLVELARELGGGGVLPR